MMKKYPLLCTITHALIAAFLMLLIGCTLLYCGAAAAHAGPDDSFTVFIATDLHYIASSLTDNGSYFRAVTENADGKYMPGCEVLTDAFVAQVIREKPDALLLSGDLSFNGARDSHLMLAEKLQKIRDAGIPVLVIPGNHDLNYPMAASFHGESFTLVPSIMPEEFSNIYADFGYTDALARDADSLSYMAELTPGLWVLMVDVNTLEAPGILTDGTLAWIREQLELAQSRNVRVIGVSHQTLLAHSFLSYGIQMGGGDRLLKLYEEYGVLCNLSGHMHIQHIQQADSGFADIAGSALITWPNQYGVLTLRGSLAEYRTEYVRVENDPDFAVAAQRFRLDTDLRHAHAELDSLGITESADALSDFYAHINLAYISGRLDLADWSSPQFAEWQSVPSLVAYYLRTLRDDPIQNHIRFSFPLPDIPS